MTGLSNRGCVAERDVYTIVTGQVYITEAVLLRGMYVPQLQGRSIELRLCGCWEQGYLGDGSLVFLHQLVHVLLVLLHTRLQVVLLPLQAGHLLLKLRERKRGRKRKSNFNS